MDMNKLLNVNDIKKLRAENQGFRTASVERKVLFKRSWII